MVLRRRIARRRRTRRSRRRGNAFKSTTANIPAHPKATVQSPWNSVVVQRTANVATTTSFSLTSGYIRDILFDQLTIPNSVSSVAVRLLSIEFYDLAGRPIEVKIHDYSAAQNAPVGSGISFPGRAGWSKVKLIWPKSISSTPISIVKGATDIVATGTVGPVFGVPNEAGTAVFYKVHVLWRLNNNSAPSFFTQAHDSQISTNIVTKSSDQRHKREADEMVDMESLSISD